MSQLKDYLEQWCVGLDLLTERQGKTERRVGLTDYFLEHGHDYASAPLAEAELVAVAYAMGRANWHHPIKQCYQNAQRVVLEDRSGLLRYAEGYCTGLIPFHHAWIDVGGKVVDTTLRMPGYDNGVRSLPGLPGARVVGELPDGHEYWGLVFETDQVHAFVLETECWGSMVDDYQRGWPLLRDMPKRKISSDRRKGSSCDESR